MPEENVPPTPQAGAGETIKPQPLAGATPPTDPLAGESQDNETIDLKKAKDLRSEAKELRKRLKAYEDAEEARKLAEMSAQQRAEHELAELQTRYANDLREKQEQLTHAEIQRSALQQRIKNPALAERALDTAAIEYDEKGAPTNVDALMKKLIQENPYLADQGSGIAPGNGPNPKPNAGTPESNRLKYEQQLRRSSKYSA
jgi:hypothetical protein